MTAKRSTDGWRACLDRPLLHIVSLLGSKKDGYSEFGYYPFRSARESGTKPTLQEWLTERYGSHFVVQEFPTVDARPVPPHVLEEAISCVVGLLERGSTVVVVDSAGSERTARVCEKIATRK